MNTPGNRQKHTPRRSCIVTGEQGGPDSLLRFALSPEGTVVPDIKANLPGRGVWVTCSRDTVEEAVRKGRFARGFKQKVTASSELAEQVNAQLQAQALALLGLARRAGALEVGSDSILEALEKQTLSLICIASDAGEDGQRRLLNKAPETMPIYRLFTRMQQEQAVGRHNVVYIGAKSAIVPAALPVLLAKCSAYGGAKSGMAQVKPEDVGQSPEGEG